jgi:uncharacterized protein (TIGR00369 family)
MVIVDDYPPQHHMLRDLLISLEFEGTERSLLRAPLVPGICADHGGVRVGVIATFVDILGGALALKAIYPDWIATADLSVYTGRRNTSEFFVASGSVIRGGSTTVAIDVDIMVASGSSPSMGDTLGSAMMTFSRLPRRKDTMELEQDSLDAVAYAMEGSGLARPLLDEIGIRVVDGSAGVAEAEMSSYVRNSFGVLQGGVVALLADVAGEHAAQAAVGRPLMTSDLSIRYLSPGKIGPFRTASRVVRTTADTALTRVEVRDTGADDRLLAVVMNTATLDGPPA